MRTRTLADTATPPATPSATAAQGPPALRDGSAVPVGPVPVPPAPRVGDTSFSRLAREASEILGDACLVWTVADHGGLIPAACHHRDPAVHGSLATFLEQEGPAAAPHWPGQVAERGAPLRIRRARPAELGLAVPIGIRRAHALLVPVPSGGRPLAVVALLREPREPRYSLREEAILRRLAGRAVARLGVGPAEGPAERGPDEPAPGEGGGPPGDGPGGAPPSWLIDHVGVGVWLTDGDGLTTYVNNAMTELLAIPAQQVVGRPMHDFLDDPPQMVRGEYCLDEERCDRRVTQPDGRHVWLEMTSQPLLDDAGGRTGTINTAVDVTDRKQLELATRRRVPRPHRRT